MEHEYYSLVEFLTDDFFIKWVKDPDAETKAYWAAWIAAHPDKKELVNEAKEMLLVLSDGGKQLNDPDKKKIWDAVTERKAAYREMMREAEEQRWQVRKMKRLHVLKIAAAIAFLVALGGVSYYFLNAPQTVMYSTGYGEVKEIMLPDSSKVFLNANSRLSFKERWTRNMPREVTLHGEAYFEIVRKSSGRHQKFVVHAGQLQIEDLSTQFDVNNRRTKVSVMLREGKVRLIRPDTKGKDSLMMIPGDLVVYDSATYSFARQKVIPEQFISWKDGIQTFNDASLAVIAQTLEDIRGWKFIFSNDSLKNLRFTGRFDGNDIDSFLFILSKSFNIKITRKDNQIIVGKK
jgi:ferric-dicitrate binding protein FerR (iron transport regulator)